MDAPTLKSKLDKIKSPGLQSQKKTVVVLQAVEATLKEQMTSQSPTAYLAALLSILDQTNANDKVNAELSGPIVYLLDVVLPFTPLALLRTKFTQIFGLLAPVLQIQDAEPILLRSSIGCLESLLVAQDMSAWDLGIAQIGPRRGVTGLLNLSLDHRPKVRKRAQEALKKVLCNPPPSPSLDHPAADMCAHAAMKNLEDLAKQMMLEQKFKKGLKKCAAADSTHKPAMIHALQLVKAVACASTGWPGYKIEPLCELLLRIARVGNEYMMMASFEIFEMIFQGMASEVASAKLPRLMSALADLRPAASDTQLVPPWLAVVSRGYDVSAQVEPEETFQKLPEIFDIVFAFLESPIQNIRISASECLISFVANCIPNQAILEPSVFDEKVIEKMVRSATSLLSVKYQAAWLESFKLIGAMFDALRWRAHPTMVSLTKTVGEIRANSAFTNKEQADVVIGKAVRAMGPEAVLSVLPLNLAKPAKDQMGRAWMLPILRDFVSNTSLSHFRSEMIPLSEAMFQRVVDHGQKEKTMEVKIFETVVQQVWSMLPGYCDLPLDLATAFDQSFAEMLANLLYTQVNLRMDICRGLRLLVETNKKITNLENQEEDLVLQSRVSKATAKVNLEHLGKFSANMLAVLFNVYTQTLPQSRGQILQTINAFLSITPTPELLETFGRVSKMLAEELRKTPGGGGDKGAKSQDAMPPISQTLMDIVITISAYLPRENLKSLFELATLVAFRENEPQLQKKAYKLIPRLAEFETGQAVLRERHAELQEMLLASAQKVSAPARRERLAAIETFLPYVPNTALHFIPTILSEVVICCKENNERTRETAYNLLIQMGERMKSAEGTVIDNSKVPHMPKDAPPATASAEEYLTMVSAGLAGSTPHMISATVTAITRILFEFHESLGAQALTDLVQTMDLFLTSNNREIVKSVLGFVKVAVISLPNELMAPRLPTLVPNLVVWSNEHNGHLKSKVKHIFERMLRKFGYDMVHQNFPESDRKLIVNIRKSKERAKKRRDTGGDDEDDESENEEEAKPKRKFENEFDEALYSSDSDASDGEDKKRAQPPLSLPPKAKRQTHREGNAYIIQKGDDDEPLDLLDRKALANISSTRPAKLRKATKSKAKVDPDGKLILGKAGDDDEMDVDVEGVPEGGGEESGVGAYIAALSGRDAPRRGHAGKLKFSNRRAQAGDDENSDGEDGDGGGATAPGAAVGKRGARPIMRRGGRFGRGGGGNRGGKGSISSGRRGLGEEKRRGGSVASGGIGKGKPGGRGGRR